MVGPQDPGPPVHKKGLGPGRWIPEYDRESARGDLLAGITVAVMLIPQSMAYAHLAGMPPIYGLYASVVPLLVYPMLGTSLHLAIGVIAIDMLIVHAGLSRLADPGSARYVELAILLTLMVGAIQLVMGLARMGFLANLLSRPVMVGFTSGAALLIALSQTGPLTGIDTEGARVLPSLVWMAAEHLGEARAAPLLLGGGSLAALLALKRWKPVFPAALAVVVVGTLVASVMESGTLRVVGEVPRGLPRLTSPLLDAGSMRSLLPTAFALALVQFVTVISLGKVFAARFRYSLDPNRELVAVGAANLVGSVFRSLPVSGSFSRSALNAETGARTPVANIVAAALVGLALVFLTPVLGQVPVAVLGALIVAAALSLLDLPEVSALLRAKTVDGWVAIITFVATLVAGILEGILVGVVVSVIATLYRISRPNTAVLGHLPGTRSFRDVRHSPTARRLEGILLVRMDASFSFMNAEYLKDQILDLTADEDSDVRAVVIDASSINDLDTTAGEVLAEVKEILDARDIELFFGGVKEPVQKVLEQSGLLARLGADTFYLSPHRAVTRILEGWGESEEYLRQVPGALERDR